VSKLPSPLKQRRETINQKEQMKDIYKKHLQEINRNNKKYPMMEYFLEDRPLKSCSKECQQQVATIAPKKTLRD
tara:strand:+ start:266 stop:487 length:222 start_codon:yes stop_codon:yes gene_type:complete